VSTTVVYVALGVALLMFFVAVFGWCMCADAGDRQTIVYPEDEDEAS
jgi:hypothetical protein